MNLIPNTCIEYNDQRRICIAEEKGKMYVLDNGVGYWVKKVRIDGCVLIENGIKKCDYLFITKNDDKTCIYLVELKGCDIGQALRQINDTISVLSSEIKGCQIKGRIVGSRSLPKVERTVAYRQLAKKLLPTGGDIRIGTNKYLKDII